MGDSRAPAKDRDAVTNTSASTPPSANSPSSRPSGSKASFDSSTRPVVSVSRPPDSKVTSTAPPATEDIDSEWPSEPEASGPGHASLAPAMDEVDSGWLSEGEPEPALPAAPNVPSERAPASAAASTTTAPSPVATPSPAPAASAALEVEALPAPPAAQSVATHHAPRVSSPPSRLRGKGVFVAVAALAAAGLWFSRGGSHRAEAPGVQALRPEPAKVEATPGAAPEPALAPEAATSAASPVGVESPSAGAPIEDAPVPNPSAADPATAPAASAESSSGKVVVIVNVRPPHARIYYRGKEAGKAPLRVELEPGKRRAFEVGSPGFMTRKIVIDGSKPQVLVGLRPASPYASSPVSKPPEN